MESGNLSFIVSMCKGHSSFLTISYHVASLFSTPEVGRARVYTVKVVSVSGLCFFLFFLRLQCSERSYR